MSWIYDTPEGVAEYLAATEGQDGRRLVQLLAEHLPAGARVLELGSGPGRDLQLLAERWRVVGSDRSGAFVEHLRSRFETSAGSPGVQSLERLDAIGLEGCDEFGPGFEPFDAIFSNKVLHHLDDTELERSLRAQRRALEERGLVLHSFWLEGAVGTPGGREADGVLFLPRHQGQVEELLAATGFEVLEAIEYGDLGAVDSFAIVARWQP